VVLVVPPPAHLSDQDQSINIDGSDHGKVEEAGQMVEEEGQISGYLPRTP